MSVGNKFNHLKLSYIAEERFFAMFPMFIFHFFIHFLLKVFSSHD